MAHPNEDLIRKGYEAFGAGDLDAVRALFADDVVWHVGGRNPLSGDYKGQEETLGFFAKVIEWTAGSFRQEVHDVLANDEHGAVLVTVRAERDGKAWDDNQVHVFHIRDGKVTEYWGHPTDAYASDEFWS